MILLGDRDSGITDATGTFRRLIEQNDNVRIAMSCHSSRFWSFRMPREWDSPVAAAAPARP